jgi:hypothetical protein
MDERPDRTVAHLSKAEHTQHNILAKGNAIDHGQLELARNKRSQAQASREYSARAYLLTGIRLNFEISTILYFVSRFSIDFGLILANLIKLFY